MAEKFKFFSAYNCPNTISSPTGDGTEVEFSYQLIDGEKVLVETGKKNVYAEIQKDAQSCDLNYLIAQYENTGDDSWLNRKQSFFGEFVGMPTSPADCQNKLFEAERLFNSLPVEERNKYGNNLIAFLEGNMAPSGSVSISGIEQAPHDATSPLKTNNLTNEIKEAIKDE